MMTTGTPLLAVDAEAALDVLRRFTAQATEAGAALPWQLHVLIGIGLAQLAPLICEDVTPALAVEVGEVGEVLRLRDALCAGMQVVAFGPGAEGGQLTSMSRQIRGG